MKKFIGFRKLSVIFIIISIAVTFLITKLLNGDQFVSLVNVCAAAFFSANLISKFAKEKK